MEVNTEEIIPSIEELIRTIEQTVLIAEPENWIRFADLTGDYNELHREEDIAPGMYTAAFISTLAEIHSPNGFDYRRHKVKFTAPVKEGYVLNPHVDIQQFGTEVVYVIECRVPEVGCVLEGEIRFSKDALDVKVGEAEGQCKSVHFTQEDVNKYLETLKLDHLGYPQGIVPAMLVGAHFTELMLDVSGGEGAYLSQSLSFYEGLRINQDVTLHAKMGRIRENRPSRFALGAYRGAVPVATGSSLVTKDVSSLLEQ